jgi:hypothetical protein
MGKNKITTLEDLEKLFHKAWQFGMNYIAIKIKISGLNDPELIINPKANFEAMLEYYKKAYDEHLHLKANPEIKIIAACAEYKAKNIIDNFM